MHCTQVAAVACYDVFVCQVECTSHSQLAFETLATTDSLAVGAYYLQWLNNIHSSPCVFAVCQLFGCLPGGSESHFTLWSHPRGHFRRLTSFTSCLVVLNPFLALASQARQSGCSPVHAGVARVLALPAGCTRGPQLSFTPPYRNGGSGCPVQVAFSVTPRQSVSTRS